MSEEERKRDAQHPQRWKVRCWHQTGRRCEWGNKWRSLQRRREENRNWDTRWKGYRGVKMHFWHGKKEIRRKLIQCWCIKLVMSVRSGLEILKIRHSFFFKKINIQRWRLALSPCLHSGGGGPWPFDRVLPLSSNTPQARHSRISPTPAVIKMLHTPADAFWKTSDYFKALLPWDKNASKSVDGQKKGKKEKKKKNNTKNVWEERESRLRWNQSQASGPGTILQRCLEA